ncbi:hypothetical protein BwSF19_75530 [Bradyrhizobium ottawaense]|nr:hypothetical protein BwSF19_75530 [Bradyrhizobium ottawaense]
MEQDVSNTEFATGLYLLPAIIFIEFYLLTNDGSPTEASI